MIHSAFNIIADHREKQSGVPELLIQKNIDVSFASLAVGDYIINDSITIERKTAEDFIQTLAQHRLFEQCSRLRRKAGRILVLVEGNPYQTNHRIEKNAIRGALLSLMTAWQIPVLFSRNKEDSASVLVALAAQSLKQNDLCWQFRGNKPKRIMSHRLRFLQGLPSAGPVSAHRLYEHFGCIKSVIIASEKDLRMVKGIGKKSAKKIVEFVGG